MPIDLDDFEPVDQATEPKLDMSDFEPLDSSSVDLNEFEPIDEPPAVSEKPRMGVLEDTARRAGEAINTATMQSIAGGLRIAGKLGPLVNPGFDAVIQVATGKTQEEILQPAIDEVREIQDRGRGDYGASEEFDQSFRAKLISGAASIVPVLASGPMAPITGAAIAGEAARQDAERAGATEAQKDTTFVANALVGAVTESLLGVPALLRSAKAAGVRPETLGKLVAAVSKQTVLQSGREATQESLQQVAGNLIASKVAGYDKERGTFDGVGEAAMFGALIGGGTGAVVQTAATIDASRAEAVTEIPPELEQDAPQTATAIREAFQADIAAQDALDAETRAAQLAYDEATPPDITIGASEVAPISPPATEPAAPTTTEVSTEQEPILIESPVQNSIPAWRSGTNENTAFVPTPEQVTEAQDEIAQLLTIGSDPANANNPNIGVRRQQLREMLQAAGQPETRTPDVAPTPAPVSPATVPEVPATAAPAKKPVVESGQPVFNRDEIQVRKESISRRKRGDNVDGESVTEINAPSSITEPDNWSRLSDYNKIAAHVEARLDFSSGKPPKKTDAVWTAYGGRRTSKDRSVLGRNLTYSQAVEAAKDYVNSSNPQPATATAPDSLAQEPAQPAADTGAMGGPATVPSTETSTGGPVGGPGAMGPTEAGEMDAAAGGRATSTKNAVMDAERAARNADPVIKEARKTNEATFEEAEKLIESNPNHAQEVVSGLRSGTKTQVSETDEAVLLYEKIRLRNERDMEVDRASDIYASEESRAAAAERWAALEQKINEIDEATRKSGSIWGRLGQFRQRLMRDDFTFEAMERKARVSKGAPLSPEESATIKEQAERIAKLEKQLSDAQEKATQSEREKATDEAIKEFEKQGGTKIDPRIIKIADSIVKSLESAADSALKRIRARRAEGRLNSLPVNELADYAIVGAAKIARASLDFTKWSAEMVSDLGDMSAEVLKQIWDASNARIDAMAKRTGKDAPKVLSRIRKEDTAGQRENIKEAIGKRVKDGDDLDSLRSFVQKLALNFVRSGVNQRDQLVSNVHETLKEFLPDITTNQTMDLISGYGDFKALDKEAAKVTLRQLKGELQQLGKIADMQAKQAPKRTGVERRTPSDEERRLIREVNELKKKGGFVVTDPAAQLKTAMDAIKTRLRNEIRDLDASIATKTPLVSKKGTIEYDAEAAALKAQRDAKKAEYDELFPKQPMTDAQRIAMTSRALDRSIEQLETDLKAGKLYTKPSGKKLTSPEIEAKRARLEQLRSERDLLRDLDTATIEAEKVKALEESVAKLKERIATDDITVKTGTPTVDTQEVAALKAERAALNKEIAAKRRGPAKPEEQTRVEQLDKRIAELEAKIAAGDTSVKTGKPTVPTREIAERKAQLEALNKQLADMRRGPAKTPEQIALAAYKTRALARIADMQDRMARGDFEPKPRKVVKMDAEASKIAFDLNRVKKEYLTDRFNDLLKRRSVGRKIFETTRDSLNTARAIMTSFDVSAVLRQGGFIALGNPARAAKSLGPMFRAMVSEKAQYRINQEILTRPNAELYQQAKLYLVDPDAVRLSQMEEAYMSRWAGKLPGVGASQRAFTTFLNKLRADSFDAMVKTLGRNGAVTPEEAKAIANYINVATGRGNLGAVSGAGVSLNALFFSPRLLVSRFEILAGQPMYGGNARTRKLVAGEYAKFLIGAGVVYALAAAAGGEREDDPRSSDFLKVRFGNTRIDPMGGLLQVTVLLSRIRTGEKKTIGGKVVRIRDNGDQKVPYGGEKVGDVIWRFLRTKFSPPVGAAVDIMEGENVVGEKTTPASVATRMVIPLSGQDILDAMKEQGVPRGTALGILSLFGMGIQTFSAKQPDEPAGTYTPKPYTPRLREPAR